MDRRPDLARKLAWGSIAIGALSWVPMVLVLIEDYFDAPASGEVQGMAAIGAAFGGAAILVGGALAGMVLAVVSLRWQPRGRNAWVGLVFNVTPLVGIGGLVVWMMLQP